MILDYVNSITAALSPGQIIGILFVSVWWLALGLLAARLYHNRIRPLSPLGWLLWAFAWPVMLWLEAQE